VVNRENVYQASEKKIEKLKEWSTVFSEDNEEWDEEWDEEWI